MKRLELYSYDYAYKAYREKGELYLWSSLVIGREGLLRALDNANIAYEEVTTGTIVTKYRILLPQGATAKVSKEYAVIRYPKPPVVEFPIAIAEKDFYDFAEKMADKTAQPSRSVRWNSEEHTVRVSVSCLCSIAKHLKRWPRVKAIGDITYGDMAGCFDKVPETCGPQVFFHFGVED